MPDRSSRIQLAMHISLLFLLILILTIHPIIVFAQDEQVQAIQVITGTIEANNTLFYLIKNLEKGDTLYAYMQTTSGNLDPFLALSDFSTDPRKALQSFNADVQAVIDQGEDPLAALPDLASQYILAWDDDSGEGHSANMVNVVRDDGDYRLWVGGAPATNTFGDFRLVVGINTPEVLKGTAIPTGDTIAALDRETTRERFGIQEYRAALTPEKTSTTLWFNELQESDEISVYVEAVSGDLKPTIVLRDYGNKPQRSGNITGNQTHASLVYSVNEQKAENYYLEISGCCEGSPTTGEFRLLVGLNAPEVLSGQAEQVGTQILDLPKEVKVGIKLQQITDVNQIAENYSVVATLRMEWVDPKLAFNPDECQCRIKSFPGKAFDDFILLVKDRWPEFTLYNQQGNRWTQNRIAWMDYNGRVIYLERFSTTMQAPDFDFTQYPFDIQQFFIRVDAVFPEDLYYFSNLESFTEVGTQLGEEQWVITESGTEVTTEIASSQLPVSRYSFGFLAKRHLEYYIYRIFVPLLLIILVAWITFFLQDFGKRIDVTAGNLLAFIAFNFTISNDLPRLGYLTFLDAILVTTFIISVVVILYNVVLKRLESIGKGDLAQKLDSFMIWVYPLAYLVGALIIVRFYF